MLNKKTLWILLLFLPFFLCLSPQESEPSSHSVDFAGKVVNFTVLFGGLFLVLRKPVKKYLENRIKKEDLSIKEAVESRGQAEKKLNKALKSLDKLSEEVKKIRRESEQEGKKQKEKIIQDAQQEAERLKDLSKQEIDSIYSSGLKELRSYAAEITIKEATQRIKQRMNPKLQKAIINKSIERLDRLYEDSDSR